MIQFLTHNWKQKLIALFAALVLWLIVNQSIIGTKTMTNVPIRIIDIPTDKTVVGMLPNGFLEKRLSLTLTGTKSVVDELEPGDVEVLLDASTTESDEWIVTIGKKNLRSFNPSIDLQKHITGINHADFILKLSPLETAKIPIRVTQPTGEAPQGYKFLDIRPGKLFQTLSGPKEEIHELVINGLDLTFDLSKITKSQLDEIQSTGSHVDEVSFIIPNEWKKVEIPFRQRQREEINDPAAKTLRIDFLKKQTIPLNRKIPIEVYYPLKYSHAINPKTHPLIIEEPVFMVDEIPVLDLPLYFQDVSTLFLDIIRDSLQITITASPISEREYLQWSLNVVGAQELEDTFVAYLLASQVSQNQQILNTKSHEEALRMRFRDYLHKLTIFKKQNEKLSMKPVLTENGIKLKFFN